MGFLISVKDPKTNSYNLGAPPADFKKCGMESNWGREKAKTKNAAEATTATGGRFKSSAGSVSVSPGSPFASPDGGDGGGGDSHSKHGSSSTGPFLLGVATALVIVFARRAQAVLRGAYAQMKKKPGFSLLELTTLNAVTKASNVCYYRPQEEKVGGGVEEEGGLHEEEGGV